MQATMAEREEAGKQAALFLARVKTLARKCKFGCSVPGGAVTYSDPGSESVDGAKLLRLQPTAMSIPGLVKTVIEVDMNVFRTAVAAGKIPSEVEKEVVVVTSTTKEGRVSVNATLA